MKNESKFYNEIKKNITEISWIRLENNSLFGTPDILAYNTSGHFFTIELKVSKGNKIIFSPHQIAFHYRHPKNTFICVKGQDPRRPKLFEGSKIHELLNVGYKLRPLAQGYEDIKKILCSL